MKQKIKIFLTPVFFIIFILIYGAYNDFKLIEKNYFSINFFDMQLGDGILIKTPNNKIILIDGGFGDQMISKISKKMGFFERKIDYVFLTHGDSDHISGLISIIEKFEIGKIFLTKKEKNTFLFKEFTNILNKKNIEYSFFSNLEKTNKNITLDKNLFLKPIFPIGNDFEKMQYAPNFSLVFELIFKNKNNKNKKILFTGDIQEDIEEYLLKNNKLGKVDYLKIPHHGSKSSSSTGFILKTNPNIGIITAGKENKFGHPHKKIFERYKNFGIKTMQTGKNGDIEIKIF